MGTSIRDKIDLALRRFAGPGADLHEPLFISGHGESGTHLIADCVALSGEFRYVGTYGYRKKGLFDRRYASDTTSHFYRPLEGILTYWSGIEHPWEVAPGQWRMSFPVSSAPVNLEIVRKRYARTGTRLPPPRGRRILDKMPTYVLMTDVIDAAFPDAMHLFVLRDPRAIWRSIMNRFRGLAGDPAFKGYDEFYGDVYLPGWEDVVKRPLEERIAFQVSKTIRIAIDLAERHPSRFFMTRYESLCGDPQAEMSRLGTLLNFTVNPARMRFLKSNIRPATVWQWSDIKSAPLEVPPATFCTIEHLNELAAELGYDQSAVGAPSPDAMSTQLLER